MLMILFYVVLLIVVVEVVPEVIDGVYVLLGLAVLTGVCAFAVYFGGAVLGAW